MHPPLIARPLSLALSLIARLLIRSQTLLAYLAHRLPLPIQEDLSRSHSLSLTHTGVLLSWCCWLVPVLHASTGCGSTLTTAVRTRRPQPEGQSGWACGHVRLAYTGGAADRAQPSVAEASAGSTNAPTAWNNPQCRSSVVHTWAADMIHRMWPPPPQDPPAHHPLRTAVLLVLLVLLIVLPTWISAGSLEPRSSSAS